MELFKNMEVALMVSFGALCAAFGVAPTGGAHTAAGAGATAETALATVPARMIPDFTPQQIPIVYVIGHRPVPAEKTPGADLHEG